jgi:hypothetical protein
MRHQWIHVMQLLWAAERDTSAGPGHAQQHTASGSLLLQETLLHVGAVTILCSMSHPS